MSETAQPLENRARIALRGAVARKVQRIHVAQLFTRHGVERMNFSWIGSKRSLEVSPKARLVDDAEVDALLRKIEAVKWRPENGFLKDQVLDRSELETCRESRAA
jgi:hypothetical protein